MTDNKSQVRVARKPSDVSSVTPGPDRDKDWSVGDLAAAAGVTTRTIRYYEQEGLLGEAARRSGRRVYSRRDLARLDLISQCKSLGMSLTDISELFDLYRRDPTQVRQLTRAREILSQHLERAEDRMAQLENLRERLQLYLHQVEARLRDRLGQ